MRRLAFVFLALVTLLLATRASADDPPLDPVGKQHFEEGVKAYDASQYQKALDEFRMAYDVLHKYVIKRNIALSLRALHRNAEAIYTLEEYLAEGRDKIEPEMQEAAEKAISEMTPLVGTVKVDVVAHPRPGKQAPTDWLLTIDDAPISDVRARLSIRLDPREYALRVHADGYRDAEKKVTVAAGQYDVTVTLDLVPETEVTGGLRVKANVATAQISVDGGPARAGQWYGSLRPGVHKLSVFAPGYRRAVADVTILANKVYVFPVTLHRVTAIATPPQDPGTTPPHSPPGTDDKPRVWYGMIGLTGQYEQLRLSPLLDASQRKRSFTGATVTLRFGRELGRYFSVDLLGEVGYSNAQDNGSGVTVGMGRWVLAPELRFHSPGKWRFVAGVAAGLEGTSANATNPTVSGSGASAILLGEIGVQLVLKRVLLEASGFVDMHGMGSVANGAGQPLFVDSLGVRAGGRFMVGYTF